MGGTHDVRKKTTKAVTLDIKLDVWLHTPAAAAVICSLFPTLSPDYEMITCVHET
jgi:hypothetical protein